jgi:hypothetical protein
LKEYEVEEAPADFIEQATLAQKTREYVREHEIVQYTLDGNTVQPTIDMQPNKVYVDKKNDIVYCPICGSVLHAS